MIEDSFSGSFGKPIPQGGGYSLGLAPRRCQWIGLMAAWEMKSGAGRSTPPYSIIGRIMNLPEALFLDLDDTILDSYSDPDEAWLQLSRVCRQYRSRDPERAARWRNELPGLALGLLGACATRPPRYAAGQARHYSIPYAHCCVGRGGVSYERLLLRAALRYSRGGRTRDGGRVSRLRTRFESCRRVGTGGSSIWPRSAVQYVVVQRRLSGSRAQVGPAGVREQLAY